VTASRSAHDDVVGSHCADADVPRPFLGNDPGEGPRKVRRASSSGMTSPQIGSSARRTRTVSHRDIELFTEITGDRNPIHYDDEVANSSRFGGIVVQGGVTTGLLNALVAEQLPGPGSVFLEVAWRFLAPVRPGDAITAEATVTGARADKPVTTLAARITNQDGVTVLDGTAVVWRDPNVAERISAEGTGKAAGSRAS
jgi:acyl dehydratase